MFFIFILKMLSSKNYNTPFFYHVDMLKKKFTISRHSPTNFKRNEIPRLDKIEVKYVFMHDFNG